jgi:hypothetical protein
MPTCSIMSATWVALGVLLAVGFFWTAFNGSDDFSYGRQCDTSY